MRTRAANLVLLVVVAAVVNLPLVHGAWTDRQVRRDGVEATATVVDREVLRPGEDPTYVVVVALPADLDPAQVRYRLVVDRETYEQAELTGRLDAQVLPDRPGAFRVEGQRTGRLALWITLFADLVIVVMGLLLWRVGGRRGRPRLRLVAVADVERARPGGLIERDGDLWVVSGEVVAIEGGAVVLDVDGERVEVDLAGHANPVRHQQPARVRGRETHPGA